MKENGISTCPHCGEKMSKWALPDGTSWEAEFNYVCFNDECSYFVNGWKWMQEKFMAHASYRHCVDPATNCSRPLPVWSPSALKDKIIAEEIEETVVKK